MSNIQAFFNRNAKKDEQIIQLTKQVEGLLEQNKRLVAEKERLELTWKTTYDDLQARHDKLHATLGEMEEAQGELGLLFDETAVFLRKIAIGTHIRGDKPGGRALVERAKALLVQYGEGKEQGE